MPRKHQLFTCSTTPQGPYPHQQIKVRSQPVASITKKTWWYAASKAGSTHEIRTTLNLTGGKNPNCEISQHLRFRRLQSNKASYKIIQTLTIIYNINYTNWAPSSEFVSSSIPSWQILTAHAQPFRGARDLAFCLKVPVDSLLLWASSEGSGETARMRRLAWTFAARIGDKYQIRLMRSKWKRK